MGVVVAALVFSGHALALDHVSITTHDVAVSKRVVKKKLPPFCKKGQKSTKRHPCRKKPRHVAALQNPPVAGWQFGLSLSQNADGTWGLGVALSHSAGNATELHNYAFKLDPSSVTVAPDLSSATLDTGSQL
ncbi:MAG TPA: hypothetical protein VLJ76_07655, partial [Gaiellaceae bacterium]|nr:hypothetical protein [Gaiellaceae bacterium]